MNYSFSINHNLKIIEYKHSGLIKKEDIGAAWNDFLNLNEFTQMGYNLLSDYRNGKFEIPINKLAEIIQFMHEIEAIVKGKKQALVLNDPYSSAATVLFNKDVYEEVGFDVKLFSTKTAALEWLKF